MGPEWGSLDLVRSAGPVPCAECLLSRRVQFSATSSRGTGPGKRGNGHRW
jgi:hypothetical protein